MPSYLNDGLHHFLAALVGLFLLLKFQRTRFGITLGFWFGLILGSSAFFFLPSHISSYGSSINYIYQFTHYPVCDWDILLLGMKWHRFFIFHSAIIPFFMLPLLSNQRLRSFLSGLFLGISTHLIWDAYSSSYMTKLIFIPGYFSVQGYIAKFWLYLNGLILFPAAIVAEPKAPDINF